MTPSDETPPGTDSSSPPLTEDSLQIVRLERWFLEMAADEGIPILKARPGYKIVVVEEDGSLSPFDPDEFDYPIPY